MAWIALGLALSGVRGPSVLRPLAFAANRPSTPMSIFRFIRSHYSPLLRLGIETNYDESLARHHWIGPDAGVVLVADPGGRISRRPPRS